MGDSLHAEVILVLISALNLHLHLPLSPRTVDPRSGPVDRTDTFGDIGGQERIQRGWLTDEHLIQFKLCPGALSLYKKKHAGEK